MKSQLQLRAALTGSALFVFSIGGRAVIGGAAIANRHALEKIVSPSDGNGPLDLDVAGVGIGIEVFVDGVSRLLPGRP